MNVPLSFRDYFNQFGFLHGKFLNDSYKNISLLFEGAINLDFIIGVDQDSLIKKLGSFYPVRTVQKPGFHYEDEPFIHIYQSSVAQYPHISVTGKSFHSETDAVIKAFFEAIERY